MSIYAGRDIKTSFSGDIEIAANGDIQLGTSYETHKSAVNFLLRTDKGEYAPDIRVGCDIGTYVGEMNSKNNMLAMEDGCRENITRFIYSPQDISVHVIPLSMEEAGVFVSLQGTYLDDDGNVLDITPEVLSYTFPYLGGTPKPI